MEVSFEPIIAYYPNERQREIERKSARARYRECLNVFFSGMESPLEFPHIFFILHTHSFSSIISQFVRNIFIRNVRLLVNSKMSINSKLQRIYSYIYLLVHCSVIYRLFYTALEKRIQKEQCSRRAGT